MSTSTTVRGLNGETFTLHHATGASLAELKQLIAEHTGIDPALQHVSCGGRTLIDDNEDDAQGCSGEARFRAEDELAALLEQRYNRASSIGAVATGQRTVSSSRPRSRPCGLQNIGGTSCYLNATLQALLTVEQLALPDFYTCFLKRALPKRDGSRFANSNRRWRLARAIAAFVSEVFTSEQAAGAGKEAAATVTQEGLTGLTRCHTPEYIHALLSNGVTGLAGADRFRDGAPADCSECWDLLMRALDDSAGNVALSTEGDVAAARNTGGVRDLFCGAWSSIAGAGERHSDRGPENAFWSLSLLRAGSIYRCLAANGILPVSTPTDTVGPPAKRLKTTSSDWQLLGRASKNDVRTCQHIKALPEYLVLHFKSDPAKRTQRPVTFPVEGLDLSRYMLRSTPRMQSFDSQEQQQAETGTAVYDLIAVVYYHSSSGPLQAIDGQPLSGSIQQQSHRKQAHRDRRRKPAHSNPPARPQQAGHYTAAVFRPADPTRHGRSLDSELAPSIKKCGLQQERNGSWWVCDDEQVRLLSDLNQLVANEVQILMYRRRQQSNVDITSRPASSQAESHATTADYQRLNLTRTRVVFGDDGRVKSTVREPVGKGL